MSAPVWLRVAQSKVSDPAWHWCAAEVIGNNDILVTGGVPRVITRGPRKGRHCWKHLRPDEFTKVVVTQAEIDAASKAEGSSDGGEQVTKP